MADQGVAEGFMLYKMVYYSRFEELKYALHEMMIPKAV